MSIPSLFNKQEQIVSFQDEVTFIEPRTNKEFLTILKVENEEINNKKCIGNLAKVNMFIQQLPLAVNIAQNQINSNTYKVVFEEGAAGTLMKYKSGMLGTPLIGESGKISGHAGLVPVDTISLTPLMIFTAMSAITGQYFMSRINEGLEVLTQDVKNIIDLIYDEKESDNFAAYNFYEYVKINMELILGNEGLNLSTLTNLQATNNKMYSNILFYSKSIKRKIKGISNITNNSKFTGKRLSEMADISKIILDLITQQHLSFELFCIGKIYEMQVAQIYDEVYCKNIISELERVGKVIDTDVKLLIDKCEETLLEIIKGANIKGNEAVNKYKKDMSLYKNKQLNFEKDKKIFIENIISFKNENIKPKEFMIVNNLIYV